MTGSKEFSERQRIYAGTIIIAVTYCRPTPDSYPYILHQNTVPLGHTTYEPEPRLDRTGAPQTYMAGSWSTARQIWSIITVLDRSPEWKLPNMKEWGV